MKHANGHVTSWTKRLRLEVVYWYSYDRIIGEALILQKVAALARTAPVDSD